MQLVSNSFKKILAMTGEHEDPIASPSVCLKISPLNLKYVSLSAMVSNFLKSDLVKLLYIVVSLGK